MTVKDFKSRVSGRVGIEVGNFELMFAGKTLDPTKILSFYHENCLLQSESTLFLFQVMPGGSLSK